MRFAGVDPAVSAVLAVLIVDGTETHAVEAMLLHPELHLVSDLGIGRIDEAVRLETFWVLFHAVSNVAVVPAVVDDLDECRHGGTAHNLNVEPGSSSSRASASTLSDTSWP